MTKKNLIRLQDALIVFLLGVLLYCGTSQPFQRGSDLLNYQCYAVAFWQGWSGFQKLPPGQCAFIIYPTGMDPVFTKQISAILQQLRKSPHLIQTVAAQPPDKPFHTLPAEYPWLVLLPLTLGLLAPMQWYEFVFAILMLLLAGGIYFVLQHWQSRRAALVYAIYLLAGGFSTAAARFDLIPAALILFALICATHRHWNWAFALVALATQLKLYPVILLVPFFLAQQQETSGKWYVWRRWLPMIVFTGLCVLGVLISLKVSVVETLAPLSYFIHRPVEVESLPASILWILSLQKITSLTYVGSFGSYNILSPYSTLVICCMIVLMLISLRRCWLLQRDRHIDLAMTCLLTLLIVMVTGKVFSPQYLIWIIPLTAYIEQRNRWWILFWILVGLLTSSIFPYTFPNRLPNSLLVPHIPLPMVPTVRNSLLLGFILYALYLKPRHVQNIECHS